MFANAKKLSTKKAKPEKPHFKIPGLRRYEFLTVLIDKLTDLKNTLNGEIKSNARGVFLSEAKRLRKKPDNFVGVDGFSTASIELRKRSSNSPLTEDEIKSLAAWNIPVGKVDKVEETFVINPAYIADSALLKRVEKALKNVKDLPEDFILRQEGETKYVVTDETLEKVFEKDLGKNFIDTICVLGVRPTDTHPALADETYLFVEEELERLK